MGYYDQGIASGFKQNAGQSAAVSQALSYDQVARQSSEACKYTTASALLTDLDSCAAYICIEFEDSHAYGYNSQTAFQEAGAAASGSAAQSQYADSHGAQSQYGSAYQAEKANGVQYEVPIFPYYSAGYGYGAGSGYGAAFSGNYGVAAANAAQYAQKVAQSQYANAASAYVADNHAVAASGKSCKKYVCSSALNIESLYQNGPNYAGNAAASQ